MLKLNWFFSLVCLCGPRLSGILVAEGISSESFSLHSLRMIEAVMKSSFENVLRSDELGGMHSRTFSDDKSPESMSYLHHGIHAPNAESWKLTRVWEAMSQAARQLPQLLSVTRKSGTSREVDEVRGLCESLSSTSFDADFTECDCSITDEYRTVDGTCNNLQNTRWGSAPFPFERYLQPDYGDGVMTFRTTEDGRELPRPRIISRMLSNSKQRQTPNVTLILMQWGQFIDHDVTLTPERENHESNDEGSKAIMCCDHGAYYHSQSLGSACIPIDVEGDSYYKQDNRQCIRFVRSMPATKGCSFSPMEQINQNTAFVDGSQVYGSTQKVADFVRNKDAGRGLLNVTMHKGNGQPLPPRGGTNFTEPCPLPESMHKCFLAGDIRVDEMPGLTAMHTTFIRLHNIIAEGLYKINSHWDDEKLFQETRRIVSALIQQITYRDWMPHVLGPTLINELDLDTGTKGYKDTYNTIVNPTIRNVFATAAFRFGHTLLTDFVKAAQESDNLPLEGHFFNISVIESDGTSPSSMLKGLSRCPSEPIDGFVANTFTDKLFAPDRGDGRFFGLDLVSLNIQRGRDHGIPSYREWRQYCGLKDINTFKNLKAVMEEDLAEEFARVYDHINDVDLFPAALSEYPIAGGLLGPTFSCILGRQFAQIKHGDRFWYEREHQPKPFTSAQLKSIRSQNLASIMCQVSEHTNYRFQPDPFLVSTQPGNKDLKCSKFPLINLHPWNDYSSTTGSSDYTWSYRTYTWSSRTNGYYGQKNNIVIPTF